MWNSVLGCGGGEGKCWERCGECAGMWGKVRGDVGRGLGGVEEAWGE